jgi:hypothetical protein
VLRITNLNLKITKRIACLPLEGFVSLHNQAHNPTLGFGVWVRVDCSWCPLPYLAGDSIQSYLAEQFLPETSQVS